MGSRFVRGSLGRACGVGNDAGMKRRRSEASNGRPGTYGRYPRLYSQPTIHLRGSGSPGRRSSFPVKERAAQITVVPQQQPRTYAWHRLWPTGRNPLGHCLSPNIKSGHRRIVPTRLPAHTQSRASEFAYHMPIKLSITNLFAMLVPLRRPHSSGSHERGPPKWDGAKTRR